MNQLKRKARTDYDRLMSELDSQDLHPVKILLGIPIDSTLAIAAGKQLLEAGLTVEELRSLGYPACIVQVFVDAASSVMEML